MAISTVGWHPRPCKLQSIMELAKADRILWPELCPSLPRTVLVPRTALSKLPAYWTPSQRSLPRTLPATSQDSPLEGWSHMVVGTKLSFSNPGHLIADPNFTITYRYYSSFIKHAFVYQPGLLGDRFFWDPMFNSGQLKRNPWLSKVVTSHLKIKVWSYFLLPVLRGHIVLWPQI